ncbi:MAG: class I SAM-dependent methyltransferase [Bacteroidales bacterium]|nr:class I SAM-dependent methyltransferase [Bacteroidales bacterium]
MVHPTFRSGLNISNLRILDLGCGKGAVSIKIAKQLDCTVKGLDAMPDFIKSAKDYAKEFQVLDKCNFEVGDIRIKINEMKGFDVVILGAIGPVLGNLHTTLLTLAKSLKTQGYVLLDDGFIPDESPVDYNRCLRKSDFYNQIKTAGFEIIQEIILDKNIIRDSEKLMYALLEKRVNELTVQHPEKKELFEGYLRSQEYEGYMLGAELVTGTWLLGNNNTVPNK